MICTECGNQVADGNHFCTSCGAEVKPEQQFGYGNMKTCSECGNEIPADSRFCPECRAVQNDVPPLQGPPQRVLREQTAMSQVLTPEEEERLKKRNIIIGIVVAAAVALCIIITAISSLIKPSIKLNDYMTISFEGYDTVGKAEATFNYDKFQADYGKKLSKLMGIKTGGLFLTTSTSKFEAEEKAAKDFVKEYINGNIDMTSGLKNGDVVTYTWDCKDESVKDLFGYKLKYKDFEVTVEGLQQAESFDPFEGVEVVFEGVSPYGRAYVNANPVSEPAMNYRFELDRYDNLAIGDVVTVTVSCYYDDPTTYAIENFGMLPTTLTKTYTVDGLAKYIESASEIPDMSNMINKGNDVYYSDFSRYWGEDQIIKVFEPIGNYTLVNKDMIGNSGNKNKVYVVIKVGVLNSVSNDAGESYYQQNDTYWYISFSDLILNPDGTVSTNLDIYNTPRDRVTIDSGVSQGFWGTKKWDYQGYSSLDSLYRAIVNNNGDIYNYEDNITQ